MWIVWDHVDGLVGIYEEHKNAIAAYEKYKIINKEHAGKTGEINGDEMLVLAKLEKQLYTYDTKKKRPVYLDGKEVFSPYTYWDFKEEVFDETFENR